ncbi:MAG: hypothetical protein WCA85_07640 [Paraburkholderia sp.]|uniref:hypothetical protein n=1 Tax=Paraburkholderia sp. TaxID=1926495 RepID=UPI003C5F302B
MNTEQTASEALTLLRVLRAWAHTADEDTDDGRAHPSTHATFRYVMAITMRNRYGTQ